MNSRLFLIILVIATSLMYLFNKYRTDKYDKQLQKITLSSYDFKDEPQQLDTHTDNFDFKGFKITPLASFIIRARILSHEHYSLDSESKLAPIDLALGWRRMADSEIYRKLNISQSGR